MFARIEITTQNVGERVAREKKRERMPGSNWPSIPSLALFTWLVRNLSQQSRRIPAKGITIPILPRYRSPHES